MIPDAAPRQGRVFVPECPGMIEPGRYRHYKGNEYEVIAQGKIEATLEPCVVYRALYGEGEVWVRPTTDFIAEVEVGGKRQPRFKRL